MVTPDPVVPHAISDDDSIYLPCVGCVGSRAQLKLLGRPRSQGNASIQIQPCRFRRRGQDHLCQFITHASALEICSQQGVY
jgi:hypothetical protein